MNRLSSLIEKMISSIEMARYIKRPKSLLYSEGSSRVSLVLSSSGNSGSIEIFAGLDAAKFASSSQFSSATPSNSTIRSEPICKPLVGAVACTDKDLSV